MNNDEDKGISVKYIYSACIVTSTKDIRILHDPWFTEGIYDGAWFHFPKVTDPLSSIGDVDCLYISHIHPDHYDPTFIKQYFERYGEKKIIIANHAPNFLFGKMKADGLSPTILEGQMHLGDTSVAIVPHVTEGLSDIDSAIVIKYRGQAKTHCVVNANDIIFDEKIKTQLKEEAGNIDILLCGYTGAGPYPQTYFPIDDPGLPAAAEHKKLSLFKKYRSLISFMNATVNIPFAGKYILGGRLSELNPFRGVADAVEVLSFDNKAVVLADNGGEINTESLSPTSTRNKKYSEADLQERIREITPCDMDFERLIAKQEIHQLPIKRLLAKATKHAVRHSECDEDYYFCFHLPDNEVAIINANKQSDGEFRILPSTELKSLEPRNEIFIDPRYLFGLLTHLYHWNNAEVGSQYTTRRYPDTFKRYAQAFLYYLAV